MPDSNTERGRTPIENRVIWSARFHVKYPRAGGVTHSSPGDATSHRSHASRGFARLRSGPQRFALPRRKGSPGSAERYAAVRKKQSTNGRVRFRQKWSFFRALKFGHNARARETHGLLPAERASQPGRAIQPLRPARRKSGDEHGDILSSTMEGKTLGKTDSLWSQHASIHHQHSGCGGDRYDLVDLLCPLGQGERRVRLLLGPEGRWRRGMLWADHLPDRRRRADPIGRGAGWFARRARAGLI